MPRQSTITRDVREIRSSFTQIARLFERLGPLLAAARSPNTGAPTTAEKPPRRPPRLSLAQRSALILQGRYMGTMRGLEPRQRARVKRIRAEKGIRGAIREARRMAG